MTVLVHWFSNNARTPVLTARAAPRNHSGSELPTPINAHRLTIGKCPYRERCHLRATCKVLSELADPIVFRRLRLFVDNPPYVTEHQIIALATRSSKACEFTREMEIPWVPTYKYCFQASEQSWPHFGHCDDMRVHLPTAISALRNMTSFKSVATLSTPQTTYAFLQLTDGRFPMIARFG